MILKIVETSEFEISQKSDKKVMSEELIASRHSEIVSVFNLLKEGNTAIIRILNEDTTQNYIAAFRRYWHLFAKESGELRNYSFQTLSDNTIAISRGTYKQEMIICEPAKELKKTRYTDKVIERINSALKLPEIWTEEEKFNRMRTNLGLTSQKDGLLEIPKETKERLVSGSWVAKFLDDKTSE
jgi:transcriptional accessory protein Tex/SPT6